MLEQVTNRAWRICLEALCNCLDKAIADYFFLLCKEARAVLIVVAAGFIHTKILETSLKSFVAVLTYQLHTVVLAL